MNEVGYILRASAVRVHVQLFMVNFAKPGTDLKSVPYLIPPGSHVHEAMLFPTRIFDSMAGRDVSAMLFDATRSCRRHRKSR
jgi:hypothetical protein